MNYLPIICLSTVKSNFILQNSIFCLSLHLFISFCSFPLPFLSRNYFSSKNILKQEVLCGYCKKLAGFPTVFVCMRRDFRVKCVSYALCLAVQLNWGLMLSTSLEIQPLFSTLYGALTSLIKELKCIFLTANCQ